MTDGFLAAAEALARKWAAHHTALIDHVNLLTEQCEAMLAARNDAIELIARMNADLPPDEQYDCSAFKPIVDPILGAGTWIGEDPPRPAFLDAAIELAPETAETVLEFKGGAENPPQPGDDRDKCNCGAGDDAPIGDHDAACNLVPF